MNFTPVYGWFYRTGNDRTASWTGVEYLRRFLLGNMGNGPYAQEVSVDHAAVGDVVQLGPNDGRYTHTALVIARDESGELYLAAHTNDAWMRPLAAYRQPRRIALHILGARTG